MIDKLKEYGDSLLLIAMGVAVILITRDSESYNSSNTDLIKGVLSEYPKEGVHDESQDYIGLWLKNYDNFYEFSNCSYNDRIAEKVKKLKPGDKITLYAKKKSSYTSFPWKGKKYKTYRICDAVSSDYGVIITFDRFNRCDKFQSNTVLPILSGILILIGLFQFLRRQNDKRNRQKRISSQSGDIELKTTEKNVRSEGENNWIIDKENKLLDAKPEKVSYILRNSYSCFIFIAFGLFFTLKDNSDSPGWFYFGLICFIVSLFTLVQNFMVYDKISYRISNSLIEIKKFNTFFQEKHEKIGYDTIKEVIARQAFYEKDKKVGTVMLYTGRTDDDGNKIYYKLIGIKNYNEIANLIEKKAGLIN